MPASGNATLNTVWAGANHAAIQVFINDPNMTGAVFRDFYPSVPNGANSVQRQGIHDKYGIDPTSIPVSKLVAGTNTITLVQRRAMTDTASYVMYDYVNLELPVAITPTRLNFGLSGGQLQLNWPADHLGWRLETQTNSIGLGTSWAAVSGSGGTNQMFIPIGPTTRNAFFRLVYP